MSSIYLAAYFLLSLSLLSNAAQGIRLQQNGIEPVKQQKKILVDESLLTEESFKEITLCRDSHCNSGKNRKLLAASAPSQSTAITRNEAGEKKGNPISKEGKLSGKKKDFKDSESISENLEAALEHYPDIAEISEMDYSPARRKPPIHN